MELQQDTQGEILYRECRKIIRMRLQRLAFSKTNGEGRKASSFMTQQ